MATPAWRENPATLPKVSKKEPPAIDDPQNGFTASKRDYGQVVLPLQTLPPALTPPLTVPSVLPVITFSR